MLDKRYQIKKEIVSRKILDETLLVPISGKHADLRHVISLNPVAEFIWERLVGKSDLKDIVDSIVTAFDVTGQAASDDLLEFIQTLIDEDLICEIQPK